MDFEEIERKFMVIQSCQGGLEFLTHFLGVMRKYNHIGDWIKSYDSTGGILKHCNHLLELEKKEEHFLTFDELKIIYEKRK